jgi:hypothetical protein
MIVAVHLLSWNEQSLFVATALNHHFVFWNYTQYFSASILQKVGQISKFVLRIWAGIRQANRIGYKTAQEGLLRIFGLDS